VEEQTVVSNGKPVKVEVPVELPSGVSPLAVPGGISSKDALLHVPQPGLAMNYMTSAPAPAKVGASNETIEVSADAPLIDTSSSQVTHTFSGTDLHPEARVGDGPGIIGGVKNHFEAKQKAEWDANLKLVQPKFSADLVSFYQCASIGSTPDGKTCEPPASKAVKVKIELTSAGAAVAQRLALAGFKVESGKGSLQLTGSILTHRLKQLAQIAEVKTVSLVQ
jgi:hypothetical protein